MDFDNEKSFWGSFNPILDGLENWALWIGEGVDCARYFYNSEFY